jgi:WXG100 family type VII secretion target
MTIAKIRTDHEQLAVIAKTFSCRAESAQKVLGTLQSNLNTLQGGDWIGKGAQAFYSEMNSDILPTMKRLVKAMNGAASTARKISQIMQQAEDDAAALFKSDGSGSESIGLISQDPAPGGNEVAAFGAKASFGGGGGSAIGMPKSKPAPSNSNEKAAPVAPKVKAVKRDNGRYEFEGQDAYNKYIDDYQKFKLAQRKSWDWKELDGYIQKGQIESERLKKMRQQLSQLASDYSERERLGTATEAEKLELMRRHREWENQVAKIDIDRSVIRWRADELFQKAAAEAGKGGYTDAERLELKRKGEMLRQIDKLNPRWD